MFEVWWDMYTVSQKMSYLWLAITLTHMNGTGKRENHIFPQLDCVTQCTCVLSS